MTRLQEQEGFGGYLVGQPLVQRPAPGPEDVVVFSRAGTSLLPGKVVGTMQVIDGEVRCSTEEIERLVTDATEHWTTDPKAIFYVFADGWVDPSETIRSGLA